MSTAKRLVLGWRGRKQSHDSSAGRLVGLGPGALGPGDGHELDEIAIVSSNADPCHVKYGSGPLSTINGPRLVPGTVLALLFGGGDVGPNVWVCLSNVTRFRFGRRDSLVALNQTPGIRFCHQ